MPQVQTSTNLSLEAKFLTALGCAILYALAYNLNHYLFEHLAFSQLVNWIFIPSGLQLLFVLIFLNTGAVAVMAGSIFINYTANPDDHLFNLITSFITGVSPLIAHALSKRFFGVDELLFGLTPKRLFQVSLLFALISPVLHQCWFYFVGKTQNFIGDMVVMATGDWFGTVLVLATAAWMLKIFRFLVLK